ncbi:MAG: L,D-transpeptidase family protein, partial [Lachnospiraceae bacterium]|nr:L,D-transpeptidase family protein [Lachnospiraceae bacterium]
FRLFYWVSFYRDYRFHSVLYDKNDGRLRDGRLGRNLSLGCVRLAIENAKWIYDNVPERSKVVSY